jgi:NADPH:quinone reductase-like Zn-dependent oxidoreductase
MTLPATMKAMVTKGHGGLDQLVLEAAWPRPEPAAGEVLIRVAACGLNNTDVNTRTGWYSKSVTDATTGDAAKTLQTKTPHGADRPSPSPESRAQTPAGTS